MNQRSYFPLVCLIALAAVAPAVAQECDLQVREGSAARDLGRALKCIDERLKALEARQPASDPRSSGGQPSRNSAEFDAGSFSVSVRSAARDGRDARRVNVLIHVRNKTTEEVYLAANADEGQVLFDESSGASVRASAVTGIQTINGSLDERSYTQISPNSTMSFALAFNIDAMKGSSATVTIHLLHYAARQMRRVTAPFNISIRS